VKKTTAFWDSSALVPLCIHQAGSRQAQLYLRKFDLVVWWGSFVEVHSAICRLHREHMINDANKQGAVARLRLLSRGWREVSPEEQVRDFAAESLDKYVLRAADALQLAAALIWCQNRPARRNFLCADRRLSQAATAAGFSVLEIPTTL
jgi:predicted nucleic acid-binding protein